MLGHQGLNLMNGGKPSSGVGQHRNWFLMGRMSSGTSVSLPLTIRNEKQEYSEFPQELLD